MILLTDFKDWLKQVPGCKYYVGILDNTKLENQVGIYDMESDSEHRIPYGGLANKRYDTRRIKLLIHGTKGATTTERLAYKYFKFLEESRDIEIKGTKINYINLLNDKPIPMGKDENGIFEYVIRLEINFQI